MAKRIDIHYIRKQAVPEPDKSEIVAFVTEQLHLGLRPNEIAKLVKETYFTQEIGAENRTITKYSDGTELDEETGLEQEVHITRDHYDGDVI